MTALPIFLPLPGQPELRALARIRPDRRRALQLALGVIWLLDAALQFQPFMFTKGFVSQVIQASAAGNPAVIAGPISWSATVIAQHVIIGNAIFATIQLLIAAGLLYRPTAKVALAASIPWGIGVWWIGEGLGGVLTGATSPTMGAPGAAILYVLLALLAWPGKTTTARGAARAAPGYPDHLLPRAAWAMLWGALAGFALQPANRSQGGLSAMVNGMEAGEPGWIKATNEFLGNVLTGHGTNASIVIAAACVVAATAAMPGSHRRVAVIIAAILGAAFWATEDFGGIFTGHGTDPNSGLMLIILAAAFWPLRPSARGKAGLVAVTRPPGVRR